MPFVDELIEGGTNIGKFVKINCGFYGQKSASISVKTTERRVSITCIQIKMFSSTREALELPAAAVIIGHFGNVLPSQSYSQKQTKIRNTTKFSQ